MKLVIECDGNIREFTVGEDKLILGRDKGCDITLSGDHISRRHLTLVREKDSVRFADLGSSFGTMLNGKRAMSGHLGADDILTIGKVSIKHKKGSVTPAQGSRLSQNINFGAFGNLMSKLVHSSEPQKALEYLLLGLVELTGAERGFVLLSSQQSNDLLIASSHRIADAEKFVAISKTIYSHSIKEKKTVFIKNTLVDEWYQRHTNRTLLDREHSVLCSPLMSQNKVFGVLYIDGAQKSFSLQQEELPLFESIVSLTSALLATDKTRRRLLKQVESIKRMQALSRFEPDIVFGQSAAAKDLEELINAAAEQDVSVLVTGETGTGKEMVARALHERSARKNGPFVAVHCAALPRDIMEAELFGVVKGAFTGATESRPGRFELANGGTLFLDEVGELPLDVQVTLLRVLEERAVTPLGSTTTVPLDFRLVAATNRELPLMVKEGTFRQDFFFRLNVFEMTLPPLRNRREDIAELATGFLSFFGHRLGRPKLTLTQQALLCLKKHNWPGNIRELKNAIERALVVEKGETITERAFQHLLQPSLLKAADDDFWSSLPHDYDKASLEFERGFLIRSLERNENNIAAVAREYGKARHAIYRRLKKLGINED